MIDTAHVWRDAALTTVWALVLWWIGAPVWLAALVTLYGSAHWEASNAAARYGYHGEWARANGMPWTWDDEHWWDWISGWLGAVPIAALWYWLMG